jgi:hypothetical protein
MFKRICLLVACLLTWSGAARAADDLPRFEMMSVFAFGGHLPGSASPAKAMPLTGFVAQRVGFPHLLTFSLEVSAIVPSGFGTNLLIDVIHHPDFRLHLIDPGVHLNVFKPVRSPDIKRNWDVSFGLGFSWRVAEEGWLTVDYRMFVPDPIRTIKNYGSLIRETVNTLPQEAQLWLGYAISY